MKEDKYINKVSDTFGNTILGVAIAIYLGIFLFSGEVSVFESVRLIISKVASAI